MATHTKLSVTVPTYLVGYIGREMESSGKPKSVVVAEALKAHYEPADPNSAESLWDKVEDLEGRVAKIESLAESSGAL